MKMRKCTKCEKKFSAEELIKWKGNRYCDSYARIIESQNQITVENVTKWIFVRIGIMDLVSLWLWFLWWLILGKDKHKK